MKWIPMIVATASVSSKKTDDFAEHIEDLAPAKNDLGKGVVTKELGEISNTAVSSTTVGNENCTTGQPDNWTSRQKVVRLSGYLLAGCPFVWLSSCLVV